MILRALKVSVSDSMTSHPLDDCDPAECYQTMMSERTELIKARREAEDNLVKTIIQLSSGLVVLLAGFSVQSTVSLSGFVYVLFVIATVGLAISVSAGLTEHYFFRKLILLSNSWLSSILASRFHRFLNPEKIYLSEGLN